MPTAHHHHGTTNPHQPPPPRKPSTTTNCKYIETHNQIHHHLTHIATTWPTASKPTTCFTPPNPPHDPRHPNPPSDPHTTHTATHTAITNPKTPLKKSHRTRERRKSFYQTPFQPPRHRPNLQHLPPHQTLDSRGKKRKGRERRERGRDWMRGKKKETRAIGEGERWVDKVNSKKE